MTAALAFLTWRSLVNGTRAKLRRLRQPRYLVGLVAALAYFGLMLWQPGGDDDAPSAMTFVRRNPVGAEAVGAIALFLLAAVAWLWPRPGRPALPFTRAEVHFLFTAPLTRRQLLRYKMARSQIGVLAGTALMTLFLRPPSATSGMVFFLGVSLTLIVLNLHLTGVALRRASVGGHGWSGLARQWPAMTLVAAACAIVAAALAREWSTIASGSLAAAARGVIDAASWQPAAVVLWPFRAVLRAPLAASVEDFALAVPPALGLVALNYAWVVRSDAAFEEASAELAERIVRARRGWPALREAARPIRTPFRLAPTGRPETAILWKNLILISRRASIYTLLMLLPLVVGGGVIGWLEGSERGMTAGAGVLCLIGAIVTVAMGPHVARNDLRQDLARLAILKTWPVTGGAIVRGSVLGPAVVLTVTAWLLLLGVLLFSKGSILNLQATAAAALIAPGIILVQVLAHNGLAALFPAWAAIGPPRGAGLDTMGQRLVIFICTLFASLVAMAPAALAALLVALAGRWLTGGVPVILPAMTASAVLIAEVVVGAAVVGRLVDRMDVSAIDPAET